MSKVRLNRRFQCIAGGLVAFAMLLVGSGTVRVIHLAEAGHHQPCFHNPHCVDPATDHADDGPDHDENSCGTCVDLVLAGSAPPIADAPVLFLGTLIAAVVVVNNDTAPAPAPLRYVAARPPPATT